MVCSAYQHCQGMCRLIFDVVQNIPLKPLIALATIEDVEFKVKELCNIYVWHTNV
jgi:hypothetical protein